MKKLTTGLIGLLLALVLCVSLLPVTAQAADTPSVENWNIALKDNIVVNFNVNVPDVSNTTISATVNGAAVETSQSVSGNICTVSVSLAAAQLNDSIKLIYNVNGTQSESREYTVKEYAGYISDGKYDVAVKQMVNQMLSYGGAAQTYFNYNADALANEGVQSINANITLPTSVPAVSVNDNLDKVRYYGTSLVFRSQVYARFYFTMDDRNAEINNYVVTINGQDCPYGKFYDPEGRFNYFADSPGITPNNYDKPLEVVITNTVDNTTLTVSYSPLNYIVNKASSSTANLPELMKAMYGYHVESYQYVNYENAVGTTFNSLLGYGKNGIQYDEISKVQLIFAGAAANSMPVAQDYYPQSADCIKLVRNGETTSVADVTKAAIQKRSEDAYHIYATNLTVELQDQDVLIVEGKFSTDRADTYYDGETMNIAKAYVYVDLSYEKAATITSAEPLLWQTVNVGPFYTHSQSNSYTETQQKPYRYMAADENDMPFEDNCWDYSYMATGNASLIHVHDGVALQISDGFLYDAHKIALTEEAKPAEPYITMDMQIDTLAGNWTDDIEVRFYTYNFEGDPYNAFTDKVTLKAGQTQTVKLNATNYLVNGELTGIGIGIFGGPEWNTQISDGVYDRHTVTISNVKLEGAQSVDFDLSQSTIASGTNNTGYTGGNGSGTAVFGENIVISNGFRYDVHKLSLSEATSTYVTMDVQIDTLGGNWANDIAVRFYAYNFEGNPYNTYTDLVTFREGEKQTVTLDATKYLVDGKLSGIGIAIFGGPAWDAKLPDGYTPDRHTVSISNVKLEGAQSADFDLTQSTVASGTADTGFTDGNGNGKAAVVDYVSDSLDVNGLLIKKWGTKDYYIEGGGYDSTTLQDGEYFILKGQFRNDEQRTVINVAKTYIYMYFDGNVTISDNQPTTVNAGLMQSHSNSHGDYGIYFKLDANAAPYSGWDYEYTQTSADNLKLIRNGEETSIGFGGRPLIVKYGETDYYLKLEKWSVGDIYGQNGGTAPITTDDMLIVEGDFFNTTENVTLNVTKSYIYYDGGKWVCSTETPNVVDVVHLESNPDNGWSSTSYDVPGGMYFTAAENAAPYNTDWSLRYTPTGVDAIKLIRNGVETSIANTGAETIVKYRETEYYLEFWPFANAKPMLAGDILIIDGWFYNAANNIYIDVEKTYITLFADGTIACTKEMPVSHTVNLDANGGSCSTTSLTTTTGGKVTLPDATRTNYTFGGWSDGTTTYAAGTKLTVTSDMNLTAQWTINQYTVNYNYNGVDGSPASATVNAGSAVTLPTPTRANYTFNGWSDGSNTYAGGASYTVNGNVTLTAQWTIIQYTVNYNYNGGSGSPASATVNAGSATTLPATPTRSGYRFTGWYTAASGGTKVGDANASYTPTGNVTVYAQWIAQYTVTYDSNGGNSTPDSVTVDSGTTIVLAAAPSRSSYTFKGWSDGSTTYDAGASYTVNGNVTFTAQWQRCLVEGTLITMADGTLKAVEDIVVGDEVLTWSFINGTYEIAPVCLAVDDGVGEYTILTLNFEDGTALRVIDEHGVFDADLNKYAYINPENVDEYIGHVFVKLNADGSVTTTKFTGYSLSTETVGCYTLQTAFNVNCVAEGLLTQTPPLCEGYFDYFEMGDFMQYDQEKMQADIEKYGLYTYEDFQDYLTYDAFIAFNGPYLKVAVGKGYFTFDYLVEKIKSFGIGIE